MDSKDLVAQLLESERTESSPCVRIRSAGGVSFSVRLQDGKITDLLHGAPPSLLETALFGSPNLREKDQKKVRKQAVQEGRDAGELVLEQQLVPEEEVVSLVLGAVEQQFVELLSADSVDFDLVDVDEVTRPWRTIGDFFQLQISPTSLLLSAAQTVGRWDLVSESLSQLKDVFYATPKSFVFLQNGEQYPEQVAIVEHLDGQRDLGEVLAVAPIDPFRALEILEGLTSDGSVDSINPVQLFQLGCDCEKAGDTRKARRLLERAEELGLDDFDIGFKLAELYEHLGLRELAIERFLAFAEKCVGQFRIEDTIRSCRRIIQLDPDNLAIYERYVSLLARYGKGEEAISEGLALAQRFEDKGDEERAQSTLEKIMEHAEGNEEVLRQYLEYCEKSSHVSGIHRARKQLADLHYQREDYNRALEAYQELFIAGAEDPDTRSRLLELHTRLGDLQKMSDHLDALRRLPGWTTRDAAPEAREFFRRILELDQSDPDVSGWLVEDARLRGDRPELMRMLSIHCQRLEHQQRWLEAREAATVIAQLSPQDVDAVRRLAALEQRCGRTARAAAALQELLERIEGTADQEVLCSVAEELLELDPLSVVARRIRRERQTDPDSDPRLALEEHMIELLAGDFALLTTLGEQSMSAATDRAIVFLCGRLADLRQRKGEAVTAFRWCAEAAVQSKDAGLLGEVLERLGDVDGDNPQLAVWRDALTPASASTEPVVMRVPVPMGAPPEGSADGDPEAKTEVILPGKNSSGVSGSLARLREMQNQNSGASSKAPGPVAEDSEDPDRPFTEGEKPEHRVNSTGIQSSLARLKSLKGDKPTGSDPGPDAPPPPSPPKKQLGSAASRLNSLRAKSDD